MISNILLIGFVQGFAVNLVSLLTGNIKTKASVYLNLWVFVLSLNNLQAWLTEEQISLNNYYLDHLHTPWYVFLAPLFYLFLTEYIQKKKHLWIPVVTIIFVLWSSIYKMILLHKLSGLSTHDLNIRLKTFNQMEEPVGFLLTIALFLYTYQIYRKKENLRYIKSFDELKWIKHFFILGLIILSIWFMGILYNQLIESRFPVNFYHLLQISTSILIYWIAYKAMFRQKIFQERSQIRKKLDRITTHKTDVFKNKVKADFEKVEAYIIKNQSFTNPLLSIEQLAGELEMSVAKLSKIINQGAEKNFSDYINSFRVAKAKTLLLDPDFDQYTILSIGLESGFNSKSVFYRVFKNYSSMTPKQWRESNR